MANTPAYKYTGIERLSEIFSYIKDELDTRCVQADWNESDNAKYSFIKNKPTIPTKVSDLTNDSGFVTTDEKITTEANNPTSNSTYYILYAGGATNQKPYHNAGLEHIIRDGSTSEVGVNLLVLGNSTASGTLHNKTGKIRLYSSSTSYIQLEPTTTSSAITITLPATTGTVALTSDIVDEKVLVTKTESTTSATNYIPIVKNDTANPQKPNITDGFRVNTARGTASAVGEVGLYLGNSTASGTAGNMRGRILMYGTGNKYTYIIPSNPTDHISVTLPASTGTIALTSQITDKKVTPVDLTHPTSETVYRPLIVPNADPTTNRQPNYSSLAWQFVMANGTASAKGWSSIRIGNATASGTANNMQGYLRLYGANSYYASLEADTLTADRAIKLPNKAGTIALTSDLSSIYEANLLWGGKNFSGSYGPVDACLMDELGANRLQFIAGSSITVEYSRDGGSTWTDYGATAAAKQKIFAQGGSLIIGKADSTNKATANGGKYKLRITIDTGAASVYTFLNKFVIYCSTSGSKNSYCQIQIALQSTPTTFVNHTNNIGISGWSGYNVINTSGFTTYGNTAASQYGRIRFIFGDEAGGNTSYDGLTITQIKAFGGVGWTTPSTMAKTKHLYSYDESKNATFPAKVTATSFVGDISACTGLTSSQVTTALGYTPPTSDTNNKVTQTVVGNTYTNWRPLVIGSSNSGTEGFSPSTVTDTTFTTSTISCQPSTGTIKATTFKGALTGNVTGNCSGSSGSCTGNAATASKLGSSTVGSATKPIYLNAGTATACTYTLGTNVPSNAVFTDTNNAVTQTNITTSDNGGRVLFSNTNDDTTRTEGAKKANHLQFYPISSTGTLTTQNKCSILYIGKSSSQTGYIGFYSIDNTRVTYLKAGAADSARITVNMPASTGTLALAGSSSRKVKKNISDMTEDEANKLFNLRPVNYDYINEKKGTDCYGFIAEEVEAIGITDPIIDTTFPTNDDDVINVSGLDYAKFVPYLVKVVQMQQKQIEALKSKML